MNPQPARMQRHRARPYKCIIKQACFITIILTAFFVASSNTSAGSVCEIEETQTFTPQNKRVYFASGSTAKARFISFRSPLHVNTDGAPTSYHPFDLTGNARAINNIANAISIVDETNGRRLAYKDTIRTFEQFRDADWTAPRGYSIHWQSVLAASKEGSRTIPCIFKTGAYAGYFGSLTSLKNGVRGARAGECEAGNQIDERFVPALVIPGGDNPLRRFGAKLGDLVVAYNPGNGSEEVAVIGDSGPYENLGEGSVALNMKLLEVVKQPSNFDDAKALDTGRQEIQVAIFPGSSSYALERPYSVDNINSRAISWLSQNGYGSVNDFVVLMSSCGK
jgi:hypothetical protein